ncbi:MAG: 3'(2'),5'-bisphosphate nucleotidase CysQ [Alphaproteobacteria bacterium GM7ARS4]|nr:3'(2'),5'-bisphosphate nucleotidase CysQ [Alphaproteobacteria bacterium GM7ARS4]
MTSVKAICRKDFLEGLFPIIVEAGAFLLERRLGGSGGLDIRTKADSTPVTAADVEAENIIVSALVKHTPDIPVIGEEAVSDAGETDVPESFWLVDAVDGTRSYMTGGKEFTVNIGLITQGRPVMGIVYAPAFDDARCFIGAEGVGAFMRTKDDHVWRPIHVKRDDSIVLVSRLHEGDVNLNNFLETVPDGQCRRMGSSVKFCLIACGEAQYYPRFSPTHEWDTAAGDAILRAAGGHVMVGGGGPLLYGKAMLKNMAFLAHCGFSSESKGLAESLGAMLERVQL